MAKRFDSKVKRVKLSPLNRKGPHGMPATKAPKRVQATSPQSIAERLKEWLISASGQHELRQTFERTERELADFVEAQKVDPTNLQVPVTV